MEYFLCVRHNPSCCISVIYTTTKKPFDWLFVILFSQLENMFWWVQLLGHEYGSSLSAVKSLQTVCSNFPFSLIQLNKSYTPLSSLSYFSVFNSLNLVRIFLCLIVMEDLVRHIMCMILEFWFLYTFSLTEKLQGQSIKNTCIFCYQAFLFWPFIILCLLSRILFNTHVCILFSHSFEGKTSRHCVPFPPKYFSIKIRKFTVVILLSTRVHI